MRFDDLVHGPIEFDGANIEDFVILRSDGQPTYHLSVVSDDVEMTITHVVRGDDHISNTPKQILLYRALGATVPQFAHVPLILGPDKKRLSKRHGATSVMEYARQGYLPEAMVNFLALLGWSPGERPASSSRATSWSRRSRSRASAAATPCSIRRSSTGSTSSTSCGWRPTSSRVRREAVASKRPGLWHDDYLGDRHAWFFAVLELLKPRAQAARRLRRAGRASSSATRSSTTRRRSRSICARRACASISRRSTPRSPRSSTFDPASTEAALRATGRGARREGGVRSSMPSVWR